MKMPLTTEQKGKLVEFYFETKSIVQTQRQYQRHFAVRKAPDRKTIWRIVKKFQTEQTVSNVNLKLFPHHIQAKQKLTAQDKLARVEMCNWFNNKMEEGENWINNVWFSDEAHFHLDGYVNSKNCVF